MKYICNYNTHEEFLNGIPTDKDNIILCRAPNIDDWHMHWNCSLFDKRVEYISTNPSIVNVNASTMYQFIELDLKGTPYTTIEIKFMFQDKDGQRGLFGCGNASGYLVFSTYINGSAANGSGQLATAFKNDSGDWVATGVQPSLTTPQIIRIDSSDLKVYINGVAKNTRSTRPTKNTQYNIRLMTNHARNNQFIGRIYYCKIWQNEVLVRDLIPVRINGDGALFDLVTEKMFRNGGTGTLTYGPDLE